MEGATLSDANLTNSYFSSSFIGVNGFGSPAESKYSMMQVQKGRFGCRVSVTYSGTTTALKLDFYGGHIAVVRTSTLVNEMFCMWLFISFIFILSRTFLSEHNNSW